MRQMEQQILLPLFLQLQKTITVQYDTSDGTATAGSDYTAGSGTITFDPSDTTKNIPVTVIQDVKDEQNETVTVT